MLLSVPVRYGRDLHGGVTKDVDDAQRCVTQALVYVESTGDAAGLLSNPVSWAVFVKQALSRVKDLQLEDVLFGDIGLFAGPPKDVAKTLVEAATALQRSRSKGIERRVWPYDSYSYAVHLPDDSPLVAGVRLLFFCDSARRFDIT